jgi:dTDP-N-acetylfucosamine:lipid II N-acetylfucosaminyltransferase
MQKESNLRVAHIHTNLAFVIETGCFEEPFFDNIVIIIGSSTTYSGAYSEQAIFLSDSRQDLNEAIKICSDVDLVVLYKLGIEKAYIATRLPEGVVIAWRFFGTELYSRSAKDYLSEKSIALYSSVVRFIWNYLLRLKLFLKGYIPTDRLFVDATRRVDLFLGLSQREYAHLLQKWSYLPDFVQLPLSSSLVVETATTNKKDIILIGNSPSIYNNHIDIIDLIDRSDFDGELLFLIPFSYGKGKFYSIGRIYSNAVRRRVIQSPRNFRLLEDWLPRNAYFKLIAEAKAAVFNSYRQMAMGNIFALLNSGTKVYLNTQNVIYFWLVDLGLKVYTIEDFKVDLESGNLELDTSEKIENIAALERMQQEFNHKRFAYDIMALLS